jgi:hypothetical protein
LCVKAIFYEELVSMILFWDASWTNWAIYFVSKSC